MNRTPGEETIELIQYNTQLHNQVHQQYQNTRDISRIHSDISCSICYPINRNFPPQFLIFWDWIRGTQQAEDCTSETVNTFGRILAEQNPERLAQLVGILLISIRYRVYPRSLDIISREYIAVATRTHNFNIALDEVSQSSQEQISEEDNPSDSGNNSSSESD